VILNQKRYAAIVPQRCGFSNTAVLCNCW